MGIRIFIIALIIFSIAGCDCGDDDSESPGQAPSDNNDDTTDDTADDVDDSADDDSSDDDSTDDTGDDDTISPAEKLCYDLGDLPAEPGWGWQARHIGTWGEHDPTPEGWVSYGGETLYALWGGNSDSDIYGTKHLTYFGRLENGEWREWELAGWDDPYIAPLGLATDAEGRPWTVVFDPYGFYYPNRCNIARIEDGEFVDLIPVIETDAMGFTELFILPDGRFLFEYANGAGALSMIEQSPEGGFVQAFPPVFGFRPDSLGVMHEATMTDNGLIYQRFGTPINGFQIGFIGLAPKAAYHYGPTMIDSQDTLYLTWFLEDGFPYLFSYNASGLNYRVWAIVGGGHFNTDTMTGIDNQDRPFLIAEPIILGNSNKATCFIRIESTNETRSEMIDDQSGFNLNDQSTSGLGSVGILATKKSEEYEMKQWVWLFSRNPQ